MGKDRDRDSLPIRFLLGETTEEERIDVEARCLADEVFFIAVLDAEQSLIEEYAAGTLESELRERFERHYLASARNAAGVRLEKALRQGRRMAPPAVESVLPRAPGGKSGITRQIRLRWPMVRLAMAAAVLIAVATAAVLVVRNRQLEDRLSRTGAELARAQLKIRELEPRASAQAALPPTVQATPGGPTAIAAGLVGMALEPGLLRGNERPARVVLKSESRFVWLRLLVGDDSYEGYRVVVSTPEGRQLARFDRVKAQKIDSALGVDVTLPSSLFPEGTACLLRLTGLKTGRAAEGLGVYVVEITR